MIAATSPYRTTIDRYVPLWSFGFAALVGLGVGRLSRMEVERVRGGVGWGGVAWEWGAFPAPTGIPACYYEASSHGDASSPHAVSKAM